MLVGVHGACISSRSPKGELVMKGEGPVGRRCVT